MTEKRRVGQYEIDMNKVIGEGNISKVVMGREIESGTMVAVKIFHRPSLEDRALKMIDQEIKILRRLPPHPNIIKLLDVLDEGDTRYVIHEYIESGDLFEFLTKGDPQPPTSPSLSRSLSPSLSPRSPRTQSLSPPSPSSPSPSLAPSQSPSLSLRAVKAMFLQIVKAVLFLHKHGVIHHDLKLENVGLRKGGSLVLMDFGYCCEFSNDVPLSRFCGTLCYCAPELLLGKPYAATPIDVWALGVILYVLLFKQFPFNSDSPDILYKQAISREYIRTLLGQGGPMDQLSSGRDLLYKIFVPPPLVVKRISVPEILRHPFLKDVDQIDHIAF